MGCGASTPEQLRDRELQRLQQEARLHEESVHKLLLLGAGESGKSTLFKQMILIYGNKFSVEERKNLCRVIYGNIFVSLRTLAEQVDDYGGVVSDEAKTAKEMFLETASVDQLTVKLAAQVATFWQDAGVQKTYENRFNFQLTDSTKYFLDQISVIAAPEWIPNEQDVLRSRVRTAGIVENEFVIPSEDGQKHIFRMFDVGGQKSERRKWLNCFSHVNCVLFVAAINEWGHMLAEDEETDRMHDSVDLFGKIANSDHFARVPILLFLNKIDLFPDRVKQQSIRTVFPEYKGVEYTSEDTLDDACNDHADFITSLYQNQVMSPEDPALEPREVIVHMTQATDNTNVKRIFNAVRQQIIGEAMQDAGL